MITLIKQDNEIKRILLDTVEIICILHCFYALFVSYKQQICGAFCKNTIANHTGYIIESGLQVVWLHDLQIMNIQNDISVIGPEAFS